MKLSFLVKGKKAKAAFSNAELPDDVKRSLGTYHAEGGDLFFIDFTIDGSTVGSARALAKLRDQLPNDKNVHILHDGPSAKFCELLYPLFFRFEKGLREAISVATCAEQGNFKDERVMGLETKLTLDALNILLFHDSKFVSEVKRIVEKRNSFSREQLKARIDLIDEKLLWNVLFQEGDMPTIRSKYEEIKKRRNDVMHFHAMTEDVFDETRVLLKEVNKEIDEYLNRVRGDISYPKSRAASARIAAQLINEGYANMLSNLLASIDFDGLVDASLRLGEATRAVTASLDIDGITNAAQQASSAFARMAILEPMVASFADTMSSAIYGSVGEADYLKLTEEDPGADEDSEQSR